MEQADTFDKLNGYKTETAKKIVRLAIETCKDQIESFEWQIVPKDIADWMTSQDAAARDRAFAAMLAMDKLDIAALERAFGQGSSWPAEIQTD